jgi:alpha-beta hydrolase superfamily lysophospholipase
MTIVESSLQVPAVGRAPIKLHRWTGPSTVRGVVQIAHGMGEHALRYRHVAQALADAGYVIYANDHRGHGGEAATAGKLGDFGPGGFPTLVEDMVTISQFARREHSGKPLVLLGHSMGSFAAQLYLLDHSNLVDGAALSGSTALDLLGAAAMTGRWKLEDLNAGFQPERTPFDWLSRDRDVVDAYIADPLCGFNVNQESYGSLFSVAPRLASPADIARIRRDLPIFVFAGDRDPVNADLAWLQPLIDRYRQAGLTGVSWHIYAGARHEVLNESNRAEVIGNVIAWADTVAGRG